MARNDDRGAESPTKKPPPLGRAAAIAIVGSARRSMLIGAPPWDGSSQPFLVVGIRVTAGAERFSDDKVGPRSRATVRVQAFKVELPVIGVRLLTRASAHQ